MGKFKSYEDWLSDIYICYLQNDYLGMMTWETFIKYAKNNSRVEEMIGYTFDEVCIKKETNNELQ